MWHDIEAEIDLLNFGLVANAATNLIKNAGDTPVTIGISGGWGAGKSTLVKLVRAQLEQGTKKDEQNSTYILMEFNAWLYQGYEDARQALLQAVSDRLVEEAKKRETFVDKALDFAKRVKLLKFGRIVAPVVAHVAVGTVAAGPLGTLFGAVSGLVQGFADEDKRAENLVAVQEAYAELSPELKEVIEEKKEASLPKEIEGLRRAFSDLLDELDVRLVVFVDDLDRCLPTTAIGTLEAMRLLLHVKRTAFLIAADESMIRGAVRAHFKGVDIEEGLVTSYFDKLIQIPLRVPRLGINEVKAYLALLLTDLAARNGKLSRETQAAGQAEVLKLLKKSWSKGISRELLDEAFKSEKDAIARELDIADQLAPLLVTSAEIAGNPRLIKRFLNNLMIRQAISEEMEIPLALEELVKVQLFERCASSSAFEFLIKAVAVSPDGKAQFLTAVEDAAKKGEKYEAPHPSWTGSFYEQWLKLAPRLTDKDLRPILHLSRLTTNCLLKPRASWRRPWRRLSGLPCSSNGSQRLVKGMFLEYSIERYEKLVRTNGKFKTLCGALIAPRPILQWELNLLQLSMMSPATGEALRSFPFSNRTPGQPHFCKTGKTIPTRTRRLASICRSRIRKPGNGNLYF